MHDEAGLRGTVLLRLVILIWVSLAVSAAGAQTPEDRAGEIQTWRDQCNDPDPDLRLAYLEAAIATEDAAIQRICIRLALNSDNVDIRNLGLRAAIASTPRFRLETEMPPELAEAYQKAGQNQKKLSEIEGWYITRLYQGVKGGIDFHVSQSAMTSSDSVWTSAIGTSTPSDRYAGGALVVGDDVTWAGAINYGKGAADCRLELDLRPGSTLSGTLFCNDYWGVPVTTKLL